MWLCGLSCEHVAVQERSEGEYLWEHDIVRLRSQCTYTSGNTRLGNRRMAGDVYFARLGRRDPF